jgi:hypothetical protein
MEVNKFVDHLMTLCLTASSADRAWEFVDDFQQLAAIISFIRRLSFYN